MRLARARVQKYRSIRDSGWFDVEPRKTILVGPNEAGKTALLQALQQLNPPEGVSRFDVLRDYPRSEYNDVTTNTVDPARIIVVEAEFVLEPDDLSLIPEEYRSCRYYFGRKYDNSAIHILLGGPPINTYADLKRDLMRLGAHVDRAAAASATSTSPLR